MDKEFTNLNNQYRKALLHKDSQKQKEVITKIRSNILKRNKGNNIYIKNITNEKFYIDEASYQELVKIDGGLNLEASSENITRISDEERDNELNRNKYRP